MRVLITGSTTWTDATCIRLVMAEFPPETVFITGDTGGVDALAIEIGARLGFRVHTMQKTAGDAVRHPGEAWKGLNERMVATGVSLVLAFNADIGIPSKARGTQHAIDLADALAIPVRTFPPRPDK